MTLPHAIAVLAAGVAAGVINTIVGGGSLLTFPVLLSLGYPPVLANVSNSVGLVPGAAAGAVGYRRELGGQRRRALPLAAAALLGALTGAVLLLTLPGSAFRRIVPGMIGVAIMLIAAQPRITAVLARRRRRRPEAEPARRRDMGPGVAVGAYASGVWGGYFGTQAFLLLAILGLSLDEDLQRINALKVVLAGLINLVADVVFVLAARIDWAVAGLLAAGSVCGGTLGAHAGRRLSPGALRLVIVGFGTAAIVRLVS